MSHINEMLRALIPISYPWLDQKCLGIDLDKLGLELDAEINHIKNILEDDSSETVLLLLLEKKLRDIENIKQKSKALENFHHLTSDEKEKKGHAYLVTAAVTGLWVKLFQEMIDFSESDKLTNLHSLKQEISGLSFRVKLFQELIDSRSLNNLQDSRNLKQKAWNLSFSVLFSVNNLLETYPLYTLVGTGDGKQHKCYDLPDPKTSSMDHFKRPDNELEGKVDELEKQVRELERQLEKNNGK